MKDELLNAHLKINFVLVLELFQFYEVLVTNDLIRAMRKTVKEHQLSVFNTCVTHLQLYIAAAKLKR